MISSDSDGRGHIDKGMGGEERVNQVKKVAFLLV